MNRLPVPPFAKPSVRVHLRRRTVRLRLTLLYGGLFLVSGAGLLAITYLLVSHSTGTLRFYRGTFRGGAPKAAITIGHAIGSGPLPTPLQVKAQAVRQHAAELHQLLVQSGIGLGLMALVSIALGWLVAGRVLSPLRTMTAATRRISEDNLHERLALRDLGTAGSPPGSTGRRRRCVAGCARSPVAPSSSPQAPGAGRARSTRTSSPTAARPASRSRRRRRARDRRESVPAASQDVRLAVGAGRRAHGPAVRPAARPPGF